MRIIGFIFFLTIFLAAASIPAQAQTPVLASLDWAILRLPKAGEELAIKDGVAFWKKRQKGSLARPGIDVFFLTAEKIKHFEEMDGLSIIWPAGKEETALYYFVGNHRNAAICPVIFDKIVREKDSAGIEQEWLSGQIHYLVPK